MTSFLFISVTLFAASLPQSFIRARIFFILIVVAVRGKPLLQLASKKMRHKCCIVNFVLSFSYLSSRLLPIVFIARQTMDQQINFPASQKTNPTADRQALPSFIFLADRQVFYRCILLTDSVTDERTTACNSGLAQWRFTRKVKLIAINYLCLSGQFSGVNSATAQARKTL